MGFHRAAKNYLYELAKRRGLSTETLMYKSRPISLELDNSLWELDVLAMTQLFAFRFETYIDCEAIIEKEGQFYTLEAKYLTDSQKALLTKHYEELKLKKISTEMQAVLTLNAIETLCFAGHEFLVTPTNFRPHIKSIGENLCVLDTQRLNYRSLITPTRACFSIDVHIQDQTISATLEQSEVQHETQAPAI